MGNKASVAAVQAPLEEAADDSIEGLQKRKREVISQTREDINKIKASLSELSFSDRKGDKGKPLSDAVAKLEEDRDRIVGALEKQIEKARNLKDSIRDEYFDKYTVIIPRKAGYEAFGYMLPLIKQDPNTFSTEKIRKDYDTRYKILIALYDANARVAALKSIKEKANMNVPEEDAKYLGEKYDKTTEYYMDALLQICVKYAASSPENPGGVLNGGYRRKTRRRARYHKKRSSRRR